MEYYSVSRSRRFNMENYVFLKLMGATGEQIKEDNRHLSGLLSFQVIRKMVLFQSVPGGNS